MGLTGDDAIDATKFKIKVGDLEFPFTEDGLEAAEKHFHELYEGADFG
jgi:hypothetical protein